MPIFADKLAVLFPKGATAEGSAFAMAIALLAFQRPAGKTAFGETLRQRSDETRMLPLKNDRSGC